MGTGKHKKVWMAALWVVACLVVAFVLVGFYDLFLKIGMESKDAVTALIALGGVVAVVIGIFQTNKRISKQTEQIEVQQRQLMEQEKQRRDARFASGVELLGNTHELTRIGGAYNLYFLARDFEEYREPVCEILCAHLRMITSEQDYLNKHETKPSNEVQSIIDVLFNKSDIFGNEFKDLKGTLLSGIRFWPFPIINANFEYAKLSYTKFDSIDMHRVEFHNCIFDGTELHRVSFERSLINDCLFWNAKLTETEFREAELINIDFAHAELKTIDFSGSILNKIDFMPSGLTMVNFSEVDISDSIFCYARLRDVDFYSAELKNVDFSRVESFENIDFMSAKLDNVNFEDTPLKGLSNDEITEFEHSLELTKPQTEK